MKAIITICVILTHYLVRMYALNHLAWVSHGLNLNESISKAIALLVLAALLVSARRHFTYVWGIKAFRDSIPFLVGTMISNFSEKLIFSYVVDYIPAFKVGNQIYFMNFSDVITYLSILVMMITSIREYAKLLNRKS